MKPTKFSSTFRKKKNGFKREGEIGKIVVSEQREREREYKLC